MNYKQLDNFLKVNGFDENQRMLFIRGCDNISMRYFIYDDSGSMCITEGIHSRWRKLCSNMNFHLNVINEGYLNSKILFLNKDSKYLGIFKHQNIDNIISECNVFEGGKSCFISCFLSILEDLSDFYSPTSVLICTDKCLTKEEDYLLEKITSCPVITVYVKLFTDDRVTVSYWKHTNVKLSKNYFNDFGIDVNDFNSISNHSQSFCTIN